MAYCECFIIKGVVCLGGFSLFSGGPLRALADQQVNLEIKCVDSHPDEKVNYCRIRRMASDIHRVSLYVNGGKPWGFASCLQLAYQSQAMPQMILSRNQSFQARERPSHLIHEIFMPQVWRAPHGPRLM
jgi:hypothetical protein